MIEQRDLIPTRMTLIERLKQWDDRESWRQFFETYWRLIHSVALKSGLREDEAREVVQETVISVSKNIARFKADPAFGSFKSWLLQLTKWRISDQFRNRNRDQPSRTHQSVEDCAGSDESPALSDIPAASASDLEVIWEKEWQESLMKAALEKLQRKVSAKHYQIFHTHVIEGVPVARVARMFGTNSVSIYVVKHRLVPLLKKVMAEVEADWS